MDVPRMIIGPVTDDDAPEMVLMEYDDVVQTFPINASGEALDIWVLPQRTPGYHDLFNLYFPIHLVEKRPRKYYRGRVRNTVRLSSKGMPRPFAAPLTGPWNAP